MFELRQINNVWGQLGSNISQSIVRGCCCLCWWFAKLTPGQPGRWPNRWQCSHSPTENTPCTQIATLQCLDFKCFTDFPVLVVIIHWWENKLKDSLRRQGWHLRRNPHPNLRISFNDDLQGRIRLLSFSEEGNFLPCLCKHPLPYGNFVTLTSWIPP